MSRAASVRDYFVSAFADISPDDGYNNDLTETGQVSKGWPADETLLTKFPCVAVELGESNLKFRDSTRTINDEYVKLNIAGYVKVATETSHVSQASNMMNAMEGMVQDLERKIAGDLLVSRVNHALNPWLVTLQSDTLRFKRFGMLGEQRNIGMVVTELSVLIKNQDSYFAPLLLLEDGTPLQTEHGAYLELES